MRPSSLRLVGVGGTKRACFLSAGPRWRKAMRSGMAAVCFAILLAAFAGCSRSHLHGRAPDASAPDGASSDACVPESEKCNAVDDDCDGMVDEALSRA